MSFASFVFANFVFVTLVLACCNIAITDIRGGTRVEYLGRTLGDIIGELLLNRCSDCGQKASPR